MEVAYVGSKITRVGLPDVNLNQLTAEQLAQGPSLLQRVPNPFFGVIPRSSSLGDPTIPVAQLLKPYPRFTTVSLYRNNVGTTIYQGALREARTAPVARPVVSRQLHALEADGRRVVGVRRIDPDRTRGQLPGRRQLQSPSRARLLDRATSRTCSWHPRSGTCRSARDGAGAPAALPGALINDWTLTGVITLQSGVPVAIAQTTNNNAFAGFGTQRPNLHRRSSASRQRAICGPMVQHRRFRHRAAVRHRHQLPQPDSRPGLPQPRRRGRSAAYRCRAAPPWSCARKSSTPPTPRPLARRMRPSGPPRSAPSRPPATRGSSSWR